MTRIKKAMATGFAVTALAGLALVGSTTAAEASSPFSCAVLQARYDAAFQTSQYYHFQGAFFQAAGLVDLANWNFGQEREWNIVWLNVELC